MAKKAWDVRKIPKSDKAKRSLYMSPTYMKNLKGKAVNTKWVGEKKDGAQSLKSEYEYQQSSGKNPQVRGRRKQVYKDPISTQSVDVKKRHKTKKTKEGGYDTHRYTKVEDRYKHQLGEGGFVKDKDGEGLVRETQNKKGKVTKREYLLNKLKAKEKEKAKKKKTVKQKTTTYQGKKGDTIEPKVKKSTTGMVAPKKYKELYKKKSKKWLADKAKRKTDNTVEKQAKRETDSTVQKQIKSGFGDMLTPSSMKANSDATKKRMKANSDATKAKMKANREATLAKMKANREATLKRMKANK
jgi:hypothetical protein